MPVRPAGVGSTGLLRCTAQISSAEHRLQDARQARLGRARHDHRLHREVVSQAYLEACRGAAASLLEPVLGDTRCCGAACNASRLHELLPRTLPMALLVLQLFYNRISAQAAQVTKQQRTGQQVEAKAGRAWQLAAAAARHRLRGGFERQRVQRPHAHQAELLSRRLRLGVRRRRCRAALQKDTHLIAEHLKSSLKL